MVSDVVEYLSYLKDTGEDELLFSGNLNLLTDRFASNRKEAQQAVAVNTEDTQREELIELYKEFKQCHLCHFPAGRKRSVFGTGNYNADIEVVVGYPESDVTDNNSPFGREAGTLFEKMLKAIDYDIKDVFLTSVYKCVLPNNDKPEFEQVVNCRAFLYKQIEIIHPKVVLCMGNFAIKQFFQTSYGVENLRQRIFRFRNQIPVLVTYHPKRLLEQPILKRQAWEDLKFLMKVLKDESK